ncbi:MAG: pyruvate kinase [Planctomycetota bacterium]
MSTGSSFAPAQRPSHTKIVATLGPASDTLEKVAELLRAGVDVFRLNTAHGTLADHQRRLETIREASRTTDQPVGVLADLAGPKMRLGEIAGGVFECHVGETVRIVRGEESDIPGDLVTTYAPLLDELAPGVRVLLADGTVVLEVEEVDSGAALCRVMQPGTLRSRQGLNLPGLKLSAPALNVYDRECTAWAVRAGVDFLGLSFVRRPEDIEELRSVVDANGGHTQIIAKIEKPEAVERLQSIVAAADGIMVARGDLGVEVDIANLPMIQKRIVAACNVARKPVIIATQMLDSMQRSRLPTRAEATDVANAILDGADACMLSGETAIGEYPRESVEMMHRIAVATEPVLRDRQAPLSLKRLDDTERPVTEAVTRAAGRVADALDARLVVVVTATGQTALRVSKNRQFVPTMGVSDCDRVVRRMCLYWGVLPIRTPLTDEPRVLLDSIVRCGRDRGWLASGDRVVLVAGTGISSSRHNALVVHEVE